MADSTPKTNQHDLQSKQAQPSPPTFTTHKSQENSAGPHQIEILNSDANSNRWPSVGPVLDSKGASCQWALSTDKSKSRWLSSLGKGLAEILGLARNSQKEDWKLKDFPTDYRLYTYIKGTREDQYLFGSAHVYKFRTANEFLPHLQWLLWNQAGYCLCKYCSGAKNQFEVNAALGLPTSASKGKPDGSQPADRAKRPKRSRSPTANNQVNSNYKFQGPYLNEELNRDILENRSNFRKHELIWCLVTDLMVGANPELSRNIQELGIKYWPGLCEEPTLFNESRAFISILDDENDRTEDSSRAPNQLKRKLNQIQNSPCGPASNEFENQQRFKWNIRLLGLSDIVIREEGQILPWLFKTADLKQKFSINKKQGMMLPQHVQNRHTIRPTLDSFTSVDETLVAFQLAIQIAANLEEFWVARDRYDSIPDPDTDDKPGSSHRISQHGTGADSPTTWFQGIWWGAEKIWLYDLVRLNDVKLAPHLSSKTKTPSHDPENPPTTSKPTEDCCFLKIEGIYRDELGKKLIVMGKMFDLVPAQKGSTVPSSSSPPLNTEKQRCNRSRKWMPDPPAGFKFRQLTKSKEMNYFHVECIAGRYYSPTRKNLSDKLSEICRRLTLKLSQENDQVTNHQTLVSQNASLFGLTPGQKNFMRCRKWKPNRADSLIDAEALAEQELILAYEKFKSTRLNRSVSHTDENQYTTNTQTTTNSNPHKTNGNDCRRKSNQPDKNRIVVIELDP
ncbi:uncharacterized protein PGTG_02027 [Puccinia graminis f. sp. tritici CRL 75-36-700-3]|uniref:Cryptic loci regulator 2 N-terminal domain-containing protein n=1 Tax=Puccinia graminis f. sp. tritici (strain CRL 75-36-700-3 / race SCCL) TaxID=418459 RepID=E3JWZ1_PUCGT|nr:uncharacterized protein PGTG_02027 [Puccinia graminis f. sp. tritici CRL 75-36-700-3]EFP76566.1 hypothetical protein PGTG_02027 [Puccinia graminis f. sp. tritici CRL 75-36-700-3]